MAPSFQEGIMSSSLAHERLSPFLKHELQTTYGPYHTTLLPKSETSIVEYGKATGSPSLSVLFPSICLDYVSFPPGIVHSLRQKGDVAQVVYPHEGYNADNVLADLSRWMQQGEWEDISLYGVSSGARAVIDLLKRSQQLQLDLPVSHVTALGTVLNFSQEIMAHERFLRQIQTRNPRTLNIMARQLHHDIGMIDRFGHYWHELFSSKGFMDRVRYLLDSPYPQHLDPLEADVSIGFWENEVLSEKGKDEVYRLLKPGSSHTCITLSPLPGRHGQLWNYEGYVISGL